MNKKIAFPILAALWTLLAGCSETTKEASLDLTVPAVVTDLIHTPATEDVIGVVYGGAPVYDETPEKYSVEFECTLGEFIARGDKGKELWNRLNRGQKVTLTYREIYTVTRDENGQISRNFTEYQFIDAW